MKWHCVRSVQFRHHEVVYQIITSPASNNFAHCLSNLHDTVHTDMYVAMIKIFNIYISDRTTMTNQRIWNKHGESKPQVSVPTYVALDPYKKASMWVPRMHTAAYNTSLAGIRCSTCDARPACRHHLANTGNGAESHKNHIYHVCECQRS